jgi:hypothetical protein
MVRRLGKQGARNIFNPIQKAAGKILEAATGSPRISFSGRIGPLLKYEIINHIGDARKDVRPLSKQVEN